MIFAINYYQGFEKREKNKQVYLRAKPEKFIKYIIRNTYQLIVSYY